MNVYVASSWRNEHQPGVVEHLKCQGFKVYDFRNPAPGDNGFHWSEIDPRWESWGPAEYCEALHNPLAERGFATDMWALNNADAVVLVHPCGRSAHLELGWGIGAGKLGIVFIPEAIEPELMNKMATVCVSLDEVCEALRE